MAVFSVVDLLSVLAAANVVYLFGLAIYRLYLHPLAKYPGPLLWRLTQWPEARSAWSGRRHIDLQLLHEQYGDVVRFGPDKLSFRTAQALYDIYTDRKANMIKTGWTHTGERINPGITTHVLSDRQLHAARRKLLNNAFSERAMNSLDKYMLERIRDWCAYLGQGGDDDDKPAEKPAGTWGKELDMGQWSTLLTIDVLGELCFGASFNAMKTGACYIMDLLLSSARFQQQVSFIPIRELLYPLMKPAPLSRIGRLIGSQNLLNKVRFRQDVSVYVERRFAVEKADADKAEEDQRRDFFYYLLHAKDPSTGDRFLPKDLVGEAALLIGAGSDTSSTAMSALFFYLLRNERALTKLQAEVRGAFGDDVEEIRYSAKLTGLPYLRACVDEAMRMSPPVPGLLDRLVLAGGARIDGHDIPAGTTVGVPIYAIHHNERYFPRSYSFIPERWIPPSAAGADHSHDEDTGFTVTPTSVEVAKSAFHAFSSGPRGCVGKNMAYMELLTAVARVMFLYDVRLKPGDHTGEGGGRDAAAAEKGRERPGEYQLKDWLISDRAGPVVQFKPRAG
ncbi:uncharacterized protein Z520_08244 [Fonsecaea multimorphosa CBS 102226]|uniref:Isotrichodermin C-15 hydroxylase n=1 Tax=Fonsecaea multimorphosa CBS 102226 TaxID=1442371 RepID=A0A0D2JZH7_9EURO|nr:uncharacterized protein Z520_08244 [Fonsecaea multimorphosa CBS 102226]KIX95989.1 hypothetical protein Z520_08244 [Fonsecaea multimorphosa CBS 102226]OAL21759.1 hypothetical protein AYO22_07701 [Fonsecaea multimorphosa]